MVRALVSLAALAALAACATAPPSAPGPQAPGASPALADPRALPSPRQIWADQPLECVPYARQRSGVLLYGDAATWPAQAQEKGFLIAARPAPGAVMMLGGTPGGHLSYVTALLSEREILVDHANWDNGGAIDLNARVVDVSPANDWSQVRVWHMASGALGVRVYPVAGFVRAR